MSDLVKELLCEPYSSLISPLVGGKDGRGSHRQRLPGRSDRLRFDGRKLVRVPSARRRVEPLEILATKEPCDVEPRLRIFVRMHFQCDGVRRTFA